MGHQDVAEVSTALLIVLQMDDVTVGSSAPLPAALGYRRHGSCFIIRDNNGQGSATSIMKVLAMLRSVEAAWS
jgi:hypothetical protein